MLARLSSSDYPALNPLTTRADDDFTIALLDATAVVLDILTFYQERLANECYLRTAQQPRSLTELSRLIGYQPTPGVAAATYVAFTLTQAPGQPANPNAPAITIPQGTQVQSVPAQGQTPQTFETSADIQAKADWTALPVQTGLAWEVADISSNSIYLSGTTTQLQPGDSLLILGAERENWPASNPALARSEQWDVVVLNQVQTDNIRNLTRVSWDGSSNPLTHESMYVPPEVIDFLGSVGDIPQPEIPTPSTLAKAASAKVFAFRQKAGLFGINAPDPNLFVNNNQSPAVPSLPNLIDPTAWTWNYYQLLDQKQIDLDATYQKISADSWFALTQAGVAQLFRVVTATGVSRVGFGLSGKVTELEPDYLDPSIGPAVNYWALNKTEVWAQSDELTVAEQPLDYPLYGTLVSLEVLRNDLAGVQVIALSGTRQKIAFTATGVAPVTFIPDDFSDQRALVAGEILALTSAANLPPWSNGAPPDWNSSTPYTLYVEDASGRTGSITAPLAFFTLAPSAAGDPVVGEYALVSQVSNDYSVNGSTDYYHTWLSLASALSYCYDRTTTTVNANVGLATAGQSVTEILGSGGAATQNQTFTLKQSPLTFVQAATPTGFASTLEVQANGMDWTEVPTLYQAAPTAQVYSALAQADGSTDILFGDGAEGATLPTGTNNIQANYRIGSGSAGNVAAGALTTLMDRPLGVSGVTNPGSATGGQDPQTPAGIRQFAPQTVLTLGRAVSLTDYQNFASTFAGVAKAYAIWIPSGSMQGVFLTIAGINGAEVQPGNATNAKLVAALQSYGNPLIPFTVQSYVETLFNIFASVQYDPAFDQPTVEAAVSQALYSAYNFAARTFGQGVSVDAVSTVIQGVPGVIAVNVTGLAWGVSSQGGDIGQTGAPTVSQWNAWTAGRITLPVNRSSATTLTQLCPYLPMAAPQSQPQPAEIIVLDPRPSGVNLKVMS